MPRPPASDPLVSLPLRIPASLRATLQAEADVDGTTISDALRAHLTTDLAKPLGKPRPHRRLPKTLGQVSGADPGLLRQVAAIGSNLNQIARAVNTAAVSATLVEAIELLAALSAIEREVMQLVMPAPAAPRNKRAH